MDRERIEERLYELAEAEPDMDVNELIQLAIMEGLNTTYGRAQEILDQAKEV